MTGPGRTGHVARTGFTLLEVVITVLVLGLVASMAVPRLSQSIDRYSVRGAAIRIADDLNYARRAARVQSTSVTVAFRVSENAYGTVDIDDPNHPGRKWVVVLNDSNNGVEIESADFSGVSSVTFDVTGRPSSAGQVVVVRGDQFRFVRVDSTTGKAVVE